MNNQFYWRGTAATCSIIFFSLSLGACGRARPSEQNPEPSYAPPVETSPPPSSEDSASPTPPSPESPPPIALQAFPTKGDAKNNELFLHYSDNMFFTFNSAQNLTGPFIDPGREAIYVDSLFRILIQAAHTQAAKYIDANSGTFLNDRAYFAFLLGALVVPWHESNLTHYRRFSPVDTHCAARMNSGTALLRDKTLYDVFIRNIRPQLPDCSTLPKSADAIQLVGSEDAFSNGIMQVAINFHEDDYVANGTYRSVPATVRYGLKYFFAGYDGVLWNAKQYSCIFASDGKTIDYQKLLRGAWAGKYNSGNLASTCRFTNPNSKWATNDKVFLQHLTAILNKTTNPYTTNLTGAARAAYDELVGNVLTGTRNLKYLTPLLTTAKAMTDDSAL